MKFGANHLSIILLGFCLFIDSAAFIFYQTLGGVLMLASTILVFVGGHIWFIHRGDRRLYAKNKFLIFPVFLICYAFIHILRKYHRAEGFEPENLLSLGQMIMARYQGAMWAVGILIVSVFVMASSLLEKGRSR